MPIDHADSVKDLRPKGFLWGASTSSYQIEGGATADGKGLSIWDGWCRQRGRVAHDDIGDVACDHYYRYVEDIALMRGIGIKAYRFSVSWPRVLPRGRGAPNEKGLDFYDRLIDGLLEAEIEPWLCLYHWDLPQALQDLGGWTNRDIAAWFGDYAALVAQRYGDRVKRFATFNEPGVFTLFGYALGWHPPGLPDRSACIRAVHHVNLAHGTAVDVLRGLVTDAKIGCVHNVQPVRPASPEKADAAGASMLDALWNRAFPDPQIRGHYPPELADLVEPHMQAGDLARICRKADWFGLNHYSPIYARGDAEGAFGFAWADPPAEAERTRIGWEIDPQAFGQVLRDLHSRYRLPIYVTENGAGADEELDSEGKLDDQHRIRFIGAYIGAMREAIADGADVRGYFVWSLLDNFEWGSGYAFRFGLIHVDYKTLRRTRKASADWFAGLIQLEDDHG